MGTHMVGNAMAALAVAAEYGVDMEEAARKLSLIHIYLQASSLSSGSLPEMLQGLRGHRYHDNVSLCTDDVHAKDLLETGHINRIMKKLIELGVDPMDAIRWGTYNAAREMCIRDRHTSCWTSRI